MLFHIMLPEYIRKRIFSMRKEGYTLVEIADAVGVSYATARRILLKSGAFPARRTTRKRLRDRRILALKRQGRSPEEIARAVGCRLLKVQQVLAKNRGKRT